MGNATFMHGIPVKILKKQAICALCNGPIPGGIATSFGEGKYTHDECMPGYWDKLQSRKGAYVWFDSVLLRYST